MTDRTVRFPGLADLGDVDCTAGPMFVGRVSARTARQASAAGEHTVMTATFAPGAGTAWHSHGGDQTLVVLAGAGTLEDDDGVLHLRVGDVATVAKGRRHRHCAHPELGMTHLSVTAFGAHRILP